MISAPGIKKRLLHVARKSFRQTVLIADGASKRGMNSEHVAGGKSSNVARRWEMTLS